ncbi:MAG: cytochrome c3 family protein, partial [Acidobacteria bacterium]|nr:cytochrome c3 family protein [Acidobacteriota bacterium]
DPGDFAELPATSVCMSCHSQIKPDSPHIQKLAGFHDERKPVPWKRVYRIPDYVFFNHRQHVTAARAGCETCHGPVAERDVLRKEKDTSMAACMDCHRSNGASLACNYCHDQR